MTRLSPGGAELVPPYARTILVTPLGVVEVEVFLVGEGDFEPKAPVPGGGLPKVEMGFPPMEVPDQPDVVVVEGPVQEVV